MPESRRPAAQVGETTIVLVAEHALVRAGLRALLNATPGFVVLAEGPDLESALTLASEHSPDVVLVSALPEAEADHHALGRLRAQLPDACVLFLGDSGGGAAIDCLPNDAGVADFCDAVGALRGGACAACALRAQCPVPTLAAALSRRERQVAVSVASGMSSKQIAGSLGISLRTVNTYRESLARKVGASSPAVITRFVIESGLDLIAR
jgi:two-component system response regulator NreC